MNALSLDHPNMLLMLWVLPALWATYTWGFAKRRQAMERFATPNLVSSLTSSANPPRRRVKGLLVLAAAGMLVVAMAGPRWGTRYERVPSRGIGIMFVLDASNSMLAEDVVPNRLERAKLDIKEMLEVSLGDRVGLVTFAGTSTLACPLTINHGSFRLALAAVSTRTTPRGGTNIGDAVRYAAGSFSDKIKDHKAIIVISDGGETDESYAVEAARRAFEEEGIRVFTVGIGDVAEGARIPVTREGRRTYMKYKGQDVWTKLDTTLLRAASAVGEGAYFSNPDFRAVYSRVRSKVMPRELSSVRRGTHYARFHWFAGLALALLTVETLVTDRKGVTA